ncbi:hypothetical protein FDK21_10480 [Cohaesibacter sp. CAU 1516]|uniref:hypothetical protein n=1 Tax=Cohaesibacter sp. CAU 1516 TaxID=2576038 RepID=UPI0010FD731A|nr:hypothetical protein [Cohaesibacter sp. CAU 1516]TLP46041.1 hypothetical protein FDK21_10480 [Cohaesibacter sp. CAU 1516]
MASIKSQLTKLAIILAVDIALATGITVSAPVAVAYDGEDYVTCRLDPNGDNYLSLRSCGATHCVEIMRLGPETPLRSFEPSGTAGWREVQVLPYLFAPHDAYPSGWVFERYICKVQY